MALLIGVWFVDPTRRPLASRLPWVIVALVLLLPILQLVPLPPSIWTRLPGRGIEVEALQLIGQAHSWRPWSMVPAMTLSALLAMAVNVMLVPMVASLDHVGRIKVLLVIVGTAVLSLVVGAAQITGGAGAVFRFYDQFGQYLHGFQGNRGRAADHLLIAIVCTGLVTRYFVQTGAISGRASTVTAVNAAATLVLALGVVLTGSRMGMALIPIAIIAQFLLVRPYVAGSLRVSWLMGIGATAGGLALAVLLSGSPIIGRALARFSSGGEMRPEIWTDSLYVAQLYQPWGSGFGTFVPIFNISERLEAVSNFYINHAHCDFLELYLEGGVPALVILGLIACLLLGGAVAGLRAQSPVVRANVIAGFGGLAILAGHSLTEYPLRALSHACLAAVMAAFILAREPRALVSGKGKVSV